MLWWIWPSAFQTFRQLLWRVSFGSWMFCAQRFRGLFCGGVGFLNGLRTGKWLWLAQVALRFFSPLVGGKFEKAVGEEVIHYLGYRQRFVGTGCALQAVVCGFAR